MRTRTWREDELVAFSQIFLPRNIISVTVCNNKLLSTEVELLWVFVAYSLQKNRVKRSTKRNISINALKRPPYCSCCQRRFDRVSVCVRAHRTAKRKLELKIFQLEKCIKFEVSMVFTVINRNSRGGSFIIHSTIMALSLGSNWGPPHASSSWWWGSDSILRLLTEASSHFPSGQP